MVSEWVSDDGGGQTLSWNRVSMGVSDVLLLIVWCILTLHVTHGGRAADVVYAYVLCKCTCRSMSDDHVTRYYHNT